MPAREDEYRCKTCNQTLSTLAGLFKSPPMCCGVRMHLTNPAHRKLTRLTGPVSNPTPRTMNLPELKGLKDENGHGTISGYIAHKCRCPRCTKAMDLYRAAYLARKIELQRMRRVLYGRPDRRKKAAITAYVTGVDEVNKIVTLKQYSMMTDEEKEMIDERTTQEPECAIGPVGSNRRDP